MKIFERDGKINFVDKNNVFVGFDYSQCCCENFGYFFAKEKSDKGEYIEAAVGESLEDYVFVTDFYDDASAGDAYDCNNSVAFKLQSKTNDNAVYLVLYNHHNGYYGHGFEMNIGDTALHQGVL